MVLRDGMDHFYCFILTEHRLSTIERSHSNIRRLCRLRHLLLRREAYRALQDPIPPSGWTCNPRRYRHPTMAARFSCPREALERRREDRCA